MADVRNVKSRILSAVCNNYTLGLQGYLESKFNLTFAQTKEVLRLKSGNKYMHGRTFNGLVKKGLAVESPRELSHYHYSNYGYFTEEAVDAIVAWFHDTIEFYKNRGDCGYSRKMLKQFQDVLSIVEWNTIS